MEQKLYRANSVNFGGKWFYRNRKEVFKKINDQKWEHSKHHHIEKTDKTI